MATEEGFEAATARYRRELFAHCYRMTGSVGDAEDLVQETYLRAWQAYDHFEHRSSVRTWMYRIATNACLSALERNRRRALPSGLGAPSDDPYGPVVPAPAGTAWLEPVPDALVVDESADPADVVVARHRVRLAVVAALQFLPPRQRAALILCEGLGLPAAGVAELMDLSVGAVKSLLQRARGRLAVAGVNDTDVAEPTTDEAQQVLAQYLAAFERSDAEAMTRLLAEDAVLEMAGSTTWFSGKVTCAPFIKDQAIGERGEWLMVPLAANGQLGAASYRRAPDGTYPAFAIVVIATRGDQLSRITLFGDPAHFERFGLPPVAEGGS